MNARLIASLGALALVIAGCSSSNPSGTTSTSSSTSTTPTTAVRSGEVQVIAQTATGTSPCEIASPTPASPGQVGAGSGGSESDVKELYEKSCTKCHGADGKGDTKMGKKVNVKDLTDAKVQAAFTDEQAFKTIKDGKKDKDDKILMKPIEGATDDEIKALVAYSRSFKK